MPNVRFGRLERRLSKVPCFDSAAGNWRRGIRTLTALLSVTMTMALAFEASAAFCGDLGATLLRPPAGEWVHLACRTYLADDGVGLAHADLFDPDGFIGEVAQPLLVQRRPPDRD